MPAAEAMAPRANANTKVDEEVREVREVGEVGEVREVFSGATRIPAVKCRIPRPGPAPVGRALSVVLAACSAEREAADRFNVSLVNGGAMRSKSAFSMTADADVTTVNSLTGIPVLDPSTNAPFLLIMHLHGPDAAWTAGAGRARECGGAGQTRPRCPHRRPCREGLGRLRKRHLGRRLCTGVE